MSPTFHVMQLFLQVLWSNHAGPHQILDDDNRRKKELNNTRPYVVPLATVDLIGKMEVQLEDPSNRIGNTHGNGDQIVQQLQGLINELKLNKLSHSLGT